MRVLISGSTGLIGRALTAALVQRGDTVVGLTRAPVVGGNGLRQWDPDRELLAPEAVSGFDAVVHLAGENIGDGRWTAAKKKRIRDSRVRGTRLLSHGLAHAAERPGAFVSTSAVGYYGDCGDRWLHEDAPAGSGFLADVCVEWEDATRGASDAGIPVTIVRGGPVLSRHGGALARMLPPFRMGLGGPVGSGDQYLSWISLDDAVAGYLHVIDQRGAMTGPVNLAAPEPATNRDFAHALGRALHRPTGLPLPAFAARLAVGEMADELLLSSQRVSVDKICGSGFAFQYPELSAAMRHAIGKDG